MLRIVQISIGLLLLVSLCDSRLTDHFVNWLNDNGYQDYGYQRDDLGGRSFGGKRDDSDKVVNEPIIFIHGNNGNSYHFNTTRDFFLQYGNYSDSEIYATTWGYPNYRPEVNNTLYFSKEYVMYLRRFVEAVLNYTQAPTVSIVSHSMGVSLARIIVRGQSHWDEGFYYVGPPLTSNVNTFVGVAGLVLGSNSCYDDDSPMCNYRNGNYPGIMTGTEVTGRSQILVNLNLYIRYEGQHVYPIYSTFDEVIGNGGLVYCQYTSHIPYSDKGIRFEDPAYGHMSSLYLTASLQYELIKNHQVPKEYQKWIVDELIK